MPTATACLYATVNPATGERVEEFKLHSPAEVEAVLSAASHAQKVWSEFSFEQRSRALKQAAARLRDRAVTLAEIMSLEMGKPLAQGEAEAEKCAWVCEYFADQAEELLARRNVETELTESYVIYRPLGLVFAVMPWNFPFWQVFRASAPALMAGNGFVIKHAPNVPQCARLIETILVDAGLPEGLVPNLYIDNEQAAQVIADRRIAAVTLTGSTRAGKAVAATAGQHLKKTVLELGGSDPYLVLDDADVDLAVEKCTASRLINNGQSCIAAKRFIVTPKVREAFTQGFVEKFRSLKTGDPSEDGVGLGPLARQDLRDQLADQVQRSVMAGARCLTGGDVLDRPGWFFPATVLADVQPGMAAFDEEIFGPAAAIIPATDEEEAIRLANHSVYGLGAAVFTNDLSRACFLAEDRLSAGAVAVNDFVRSDPRLPFGGIMESGYGRELGEDGIREFTNIKTVCIA